MFKVLALSALALVSAVPSSEFVTSENIKQEFAIRNSFQTFKTTHNKHYGNEAEESRRFAIFRENLDKITKMNAKSKKATFAINKFSDLSASEFAATHFGFKPAAKGSAKAASRASHAVIKPFPRNGLNATSADWRTKGAVTPVKDQGQCGSCWAFSAVEEVESAIFLSTGKLPTLSEQQVVSCDDVDGGCNGGDTPSAYDYILDNGLETESDYPYKSGSGSSGTCKYSSSKATYAMDSWSYAIDPCYDDCDNQDEDTLTTNVAGYGPASICVNADAFQSYDSGILDADECGPSDYYSLNHCVQIVGFDTSKSSSSYWIVRNSWGSSWGEKGYVRMEFGTNACGLADEVTFVQA